MDEHVKFLTLRAVVKKETLLRVLKMSGRTFISGIIPSDEIGDHFFITFFFSAEPHAESSLLLTLVSSTIVGIQRYTTKRLEYQGIHLIEVVRDDSLLSEAIVAHFVAKEEDTRAVLEDMWDSEMPRSWFKDYKNFAGDLNPRLQFVINDPDADLLTQLFLLRDPR